MYSVQAYSNDFLLGCSLVVLTFCFAVGCLTDIVMRDRGFGPIGNALLICVGGITGLWAHTQWIGPLSQTSLTWFLGASAGFAALTLLGLGLLKNRLGY